MATVIHDHNTPERTEVVHHDADSGSGVGTILGVILAIVLVALLLFYGLPLLNRAGGNDIPNRIDVNVNGNLPTPSGGTAQ